MPDVVVVNKPTGVNMGGSQAVPPQDAVFDNAVLNTALDYGLDQEAFTETATQAESPKVGMVTRNACSRKQPEIYAPSMEGNK